MVAEDFDDFVRFSLRHGIYTSNGLSDPKKTVVVRKSQEYNRHVFSPGNGCVWEIYNVKFVALIHGPMACSFIQPSLLFPFSSVIQSFFRLFRVSGIMLGCEETDIIKTFTLF